MKTIIFDDWIKLPQKARARSRFILEQFDVTALKRGKRAPARARRHGKKRPQPR